MGAWLEMEPVTDEVSLMLYFWALGGVLHLRVDSTSEKCGRSQTAVQMWLKTKKLCSCKTSWFHGICVSVIQSHFPECAYN